MQDKQTSVILAVGAHTGDAQLTSGMLLARHAQQGDKIITLDLTAGERGAPKGVSISDFRKRNIDGAAAFARMLGGKSIVFDVPDGELYPCKELELRVADVMREHKVTQVLYHWKNSLHKDHVSAHTITKNAIFFASLPTFEHPLPPARITRAMMAENWEDSEGFQPYFYVDVSDGFELWKKAIVNLWLAENSTSFKYLRYYEALSVCRGALIGKQHASAFAAFDYAKRQVLEI
ncbi:MAG TPA: PIG-L family deacetylase [Clostridia bacterium]|jgi:LmbE family N-acetylglucosaminyl deacetylase|nr:PIG-L family deacetylase [Clostridia bacterium]HPA60815.1 PIG-L family deacetylase [Clostridia bacterium]HQA98206.1 PIG-L family deacetylase [Clostridia bacterium]HQO55268.1 PIG-L family deacetylase [Clostridia bacterium]HUM61043.1 PIG-L family deacetylase [Clostridia bacterium]